MADLVLVRLLEIPVSARLVSPPTTALGPVGRPRSSLPKLSTRSPAAACLACCSLKSPGLDQGCSLGLGLLTCHLAWASFEHNTQSHHHYEGTSPAAGNSGLLFLPRPQATCSPGESVQNDPGAWKQSSQALRVTRSTLPINQVWWHMPDTPPLRELKGLEAAHPSSDCQQLPPLLYINHFLKLPHYGPTGVPGEPLEMVTSFLLPLLSWFVSLYHVVSVLCMGSSWSVPLSSRPELGE